MLAATTSPWYFPTWVSSRTPVTSPMAHRPSPARRWVSTGNAVPVGVDADRVEADPVHAGAPAGGDEQVVAAHLAAVIEREDVVLGVAPGRRRLDAQDQFDSVTA